MKSRTWHHYHSDPGISWNRRYVIPGDDIWLRKARDSGAVGWGFVPSWLYVYPFSLSTMHTNMFLISLDSFRLETTTAYRYCCGHLPCVRACVRTLSLAFTFFYIIWLWNKAGLWLIFCLVTVISLVQDSAERLSFRYFRRKSDGAVSFIASFGSHVEGPPGFVHGGCSAAVLDSAMGMVAWTGGHRSVTANLTCNYR